MNHGIIKELVVATLGFSAEKVDQAERYAHVVGRCLMQGGVIGAVLENIINDYAYSASAPLLAAQIEKATLDAATTKAEPERKSSLRL